MASRAVIFACVLHGSAYGLLAQDAEITKHDTVVATSNDVELTELGTTVRLTHGQMMEVLDVSAGSLYVRTKRSGGHTVTGWVNRSDVVKPDLAIGVHNPLDESVQIWIRCNSHQKWDSMWVVAGTDRAWPADHAGTYKILFRRQGAADKNLGVYRVPSESGRNIKVGYRLETRTRTVTKFVYRDEEYRCSKCGRIHTRKVKQAVKEEQTYDVMVPFVEEW